MKTTKNKKNYRIIPVLDISGGVVVHAVKGKRKEYKPLKSILSTSIDPVDIAISLKAFGFDELYLADLASITGGEPSLSLFNRISDKTNLELLVDAGVTNIKRAEELCNNGVSKVIIGTETLLNMGFIAEAIEFLGSDNVIVSLDLIGYRIMSGFKLGRLAEPIPYLHRLEKMGVSQIILLDLKKVGSREGVNLDFLKEVLQNTEAKVIVGGGIRDFKDLIELKNLGVVGVLLATALHSGEITSYELRKAGLI